MPWEADGVDEDDKEERSKRQILGSTGHDALVIRDFLGRDMVEMEESERGR